MRGHLTMEECGARYPNLVAAMKWSGILTTSEATSAIRDWRSFRAGVYQYEPLGSEAVHHAGGVRTALRHAWKCRHAVRSLGLYPHTTTKPQRSEEIS